MTTIWKSKEAAQLHALVDMAFNSAWFKEDTYLAGSALALHKETLALNKDNPDALPGLQKAHDEARALFDSLFERDVGFTSGGKQVAVPCATDSEPQEGARE